MKNICDNTCNNGENPCVKCQEEAVKEEKILKSGNEKATSPVASSFTRTDSDMAYICDKHGLRSGQDICTICTPELCSCGQIKAFQPTMMSDRYSVPDPHADCKWYADEYVKGEGDLRQELGRTDARTQIWQ